MAEKWVLTLFGENKSITNPINKSELFLCSDLFEDYKKCKVLYNKGLRKKEQCVEMRVTAQKCYVLDQEDFEKELIRHFNEKKKYIKYLKEEGSILYNHYRADPTVFSLFKLDHETSPESIKSINEYLSI